MTMNGAQILAEPGSQWWCGIARSRIAEPGS
jgi:hypothetical protein